jgi:hypothetical protein
VDTVELDRVARAFSDFGAAMAIAQTLAAHGRSGPEFERALARATKSLDIVDRAMARLDVPQPQQAMLTISPILRARLYALSGEQDHLGSPR